MQRSSLLLLVFVLVAAALVALPSLAAPPPAASADGARAAMVLLDQRGVTASPTLCFDGAAGAFRIGDACLPLITAHAAATDERGGVVRLDRRGARARLNEGRGWFDVLPEGPPPDDKSASARAVDRRVYNMSGRLAFATSGPAVWLDGSRLPGRTDDKDDPLRAALSKRLAQDAPDEAAALRARDTRFRVLGRGHVDLDGDGLPDEIVECLATRDRAVADSAGRSWETIVSALYLLPDTRGKKPATPELIDTFTDGSFALGPILDLDGDRRSELLVGLLDTRSPGPPGYVHRVVKPCLSGCLPSRQLGVRLLAWTHAVSPQVFLNSSRSSPMTARARATSKISDGPPASRAPSAGSSENPTAFQNGRRWCSAAVVVRPMRL